MRRLTRRTLLKGSGTVALLSGSVGTGTLFTATAASAAAEAAHSVAAPDTAAREGGVVESAGNAYHYFDTQEAELVEATVERLIPADDNGPGALEANVPLFIDRQLAGAWGAGERLYRTGPWYAGEPTQGYQMPFTPAEYFRVGFHAIIRDLDERKTSFARLSEQEQDQYLTRLEKGELDLDGIPSDQFFDALLDMTTRGFFSDPVYGGNKDMVAWRMIGFPGTYSSYYQLVDQYGFKLDREPTSIAQDEHGRIHINPDIPPHLYPTTAATDSTHHGHG